MSPGELNSRIEICKHDEISDGAGGFERSLVPVAKVWANVDSVSAREFFQARAAQVELSHKVTIRYNKSVNRTQVVLIEGKEFDIQYVLEIGNKEFMELHVVERA